MYRDFLSILYEIFHSQKILHDRTILYTHFDVDLFFSLFSDIWILVSSAKYRPIQYRSKVKTKGTKFTLNLY